MLEKMLGFTENVFVEVQASWNPHQSTWLATAHGARECHERLFGMMWQLQAALNQYGYLSVSNDRDECSGRFQLRGFRIWFECTRIVFRYWAYWAYTGHAHYKWPLNHNSPIIITIVPIIGRVH